MTTKNKIAFFYPSYFPVSGGSSVHGYHLAKQLTVLGYRLTTFTSLPDGFTQHQKKSAFNVLRAILFADIVYVRIGTGGISRRIPLIARLCGKKVIAEVNGPADELIVTKSKNQKAVQKSDKSLTRILRKANAVITVSELMGNYCRSDLHCRQVFVIGNGGEQFRLSDLNIDDGFRNKMNGIRLNHKKIVVWSGTTYPWQGFDKISKLIHTAPEDIAFLLISNDQQVWKNVEHHKNVFCFEKLSRDEAAFLILESDVGLAIYGDFSWSRFKEFHGSSLKYYEYYANGLSVIATPTGHMKGIRDPRVCVTDEVDEMIEFIYSSRKAVGQFEFRGWQKVAGETSDVIEQVLRG